jgi:hypothetical protein
MPAILTQDQLPAWFGEVPLPLDEVKAMLRPFPAAGMIRSLLSAKRPIRRWGSPTPVKPGSHRILRAYI